MTNDTEWFRSAVFYEVLLSAFADSTGSGVGDLGGLMGRLDYLQWLGVDCLWLPPFFPSPWRDGGYDVSDFCNVDPRFGSLDDFAALIAEVHRREMRLIMDLPLNHTSDAHPWFAASREDPEGPYGDYYVWRDDDSGYPDARIIFVDTQESNWSFDPIRRQFYWHRFFEHQPDLNFDNPAVQEEILEILRFWARLGVDGFRLDAVPYLFEEEGTNCENLEPTHKFIARLREMIDTEFPGRVLLAEANQWPADVLPYFGSPEQPECQMCFHFPVMPRIFYALRDERAEAIERILADTPDLPPGTQWGTFLRNHDELTLEMVSTTERAKMYDWYAQDIRMKSNVGIRRRLASLLDNNRAELELAHVLILSLPGSPFLYYGDEIGMGDNIWLEDRDAVRTPMQWTPDRNAGFSTADPGRLYLPVNQSLVYNYQSVNVESQQAQRNSLLAWVRRMLMLRRRFPVLATGDLKVRESNNEAILAFTRVDLPGSSSASGGNVIGAAMLCVANLSSQAQSVTVNVPEFAGWKLNEVTSGGVFPPVEADGQVVLTLGPRGYYWLLIEPEIIAPEMPTAPVADAAPKSVPTETEEP